METVVASDQRNTKTTTSWWVLPNLWCENSICEDPAACGNREPPPPLQDPLSEEENERWGLYVNALLRGDTGRVFEAPSLSNVPHIRQKTTWDCGVTCVEMILGWLRDGHSTVKRAQLLSFIQTESIWTVDLVLLLDHCLRCKDVDARYLFCTSALQVNTNLHQFAYYETAFDKDRERVSRIFDLIRYEKMPVVEHRRLPMEEVVKLVQRPDCIAIVLVDNSILTQQTIGCPNVCEQTYSGHYVLLIGTSSDPTEVAEVETTDYPYCLVLRNSGCDKESMFVSVELLEKAWRSPGTDEDIVFIVNHKLAPPLE